MEPTWNKRLPTNPNNPMTQNLINLHFSLSPVPNRNSSIYETDEFRMYKFKVLVCDKHFSHDWTSCPFTHPGERAHRRDPRTYLPVLCPFFRDNDICRRGEGCKFAHGLFEYFLHPGKYRTSECLNGPNCDRKVCFFAHDETELRDEMFLNGEEIYAAFTFNAGMPVSIAPRQVLRALAARTKFSNYKKTFGAANKSVGAPSPRNGVILGIPALSPSTHKGKAIATEEFSRVADPADLLGLDYSPASIWSAALNSWPYDFSGLADLLKEMSDAKTSQNSKLGDDDEDAPAREYRLWD